MSEYRVVLRLESLRFGASDDAPHILSTGLFSYRGLYVLEHRMMPHTFLSTGLFSYWSLHVLGHQMMPHIFLSTGLFSRWSLYILGHRMMPNIFLIFVVHNLIDETYEFIINVPVGKIFGPYMPRVAFENCTVKENLPVIIK